MIPSDVTEAPCAAKMLMFYSMRLVVKMCEFEFGKHLVQMSVERANLLEVPTIQWRSADRHPE